MPITLTLFVVLLFDGDGDTTIIASFYSMLAVYIQRVNINILSYPMLIP